MVRRFVLLALPLALLGFADDPSGTGSGFFGAVVTDGGVALSGADSRPGSSSGTGSHHGSSSSADADPALPEIDPKGTCPDAIAPCGLTGDGGAAAPAPAPAGTPAVTLADIAEFRPAAIAPSSEPKGWGVQGLDTNPIASAGTQTVGGTLLGRPAAVRFTPVGYLWDYGDGATRATTTGGASWERLGVREFDPTPTSHVYVARGDYTLTLRVQYSAAYSWGGAAFTPIDGVVTGPAASVPMRIVVESTVLVGADCGSGSSAPGCG